MSDERTQHDQPEPPDQPGRSDQPEQPEQAPQWLTPPDPYATQPGEPPAPPPQWPAPPPVEQQPGPGGVHPLDVGRALSVGWSLFRFRWKSMLGAAFVIMLPAYLVEIALSIYSAQTLETWGAAANEIWMDVINQGGSPALSDLPPFPFMALVAAFAGGIIVSLATMVVGGALVHIIGWTYGGGRVTAGSALRAAANRLPSLLGAGLLIGLVVVLVIVGGVALFIALLAATGFQPGLLALLGFIIVVAAFAAVVFLAVRWQFYTQAIMLEGAGAVASLGRSWRLVSGSSWRVLGYLLLMIVLAALVGIAASIPAILLFGAGFDPATGQPLAYDAARTSGQTAISTLASLLVLPFYVAVMTLLYYDLRWRRQEQIGPPPA